MFEAGAEDCRGSIGRTRPALLGTPQRVAYVSIGLPLHVLQVPARPSTPSEAPRVTEVLTANGPQRLLMTEGRAFDQRLKPPLQTTHNSSTVRKSQFKFTDKSGSFRAETNSCRKSDQNTQKLKQQQQQQEKPTTNKQKPKTKEKSNTRKAKSITPQ